jgi:hypothetical protein
MATPPPGTTWNSSLDLISPSKSTVRDSTNVIDLNDVSMEDRSSSPLAHKRPGMKANILDTRSKEDEDPSEEETSGKMSLIQTRRVSANAVRRVYSGRNKARSKASGNRARAIVEEDHDGSTDEYTDDDDGRRTTTGIPKQESITSNHHYTFNMPNMPGSRSEVPYMLLG